MRLRTSATCIYLIALLGTGIYAADEAVSKSDVQLDDTTKRNYRFAIQQAQDELELVREMLKVVGVEAEAQKKLDEQLVAALGKLKIVAEEIEAGKKPTDSLEAAKKERGAYEKALAESLPKDKAQALVRKLQSPQVQGNRFARALRHNLDAMNLGGTEWSKATFIVEDLEKAFKAMADEFPTEQEELNRVRAQFQAALYNAGDRLLDVLNKEQIEKLKKAMPAIFREGK